jgi:hypothetical protein
MYIHISLNKEKYLKLYTFFTAQLWSFFAIGYKIVMVFLFD